MSTLTEKIRALLREEYPDYEYDIEPRGTRFTGITQTRYKGLSIRRMDEAMSVLFSPYNVTYKSSPEFMCEFLQPILDIGSLDFWFPAYLIDRPETYVIAYTSRRKLCISEATWEKGHWVEYPKNRGRYKFLAYSGPLHL